MASDEDLFAFSSGDEFHYSSAQPSLPPSMPKVVRPTAPPTSQRQQRLDEFACRTRPASWTDVDAFYKGVRLWTVSAPVLKLLPPPFPTNSRPLPFPLQ